MKAAIEKIAKAMPARKRDVIDVRAPAYAPTPEQMRHGRYVEGDVVETKPGGKSITIGKAFRKEARFERIKGLSDEQLKALRYYRPEFDLSEASEVKSALDIRPRGNGGLSSQEVWVERQAGARMRMKALEYGLGAAVHALRDVALRDMTFSDLAIKRYGSREVSKIITGKGRQKPRIVNEIAPKSGKHREAVRVEFFLAVTRLVDNVRPYLKTGG
ncbi:hypothetical protein ACKU27_01055 [Sphingobium yanoikuyae]|uniref:hypothetical protein n=1 Tax=Sphingobium yanoikuyae TaxID=13690 RepID=UPI003B8F213C